MDRNVFMNFHITRFFFYLMSLLCLIELSKLKEFFSIKTLVRVVDELLKVGGVLVTTFLSFVAFFNFLSVYCRP